MTLDGKRIGFALTGSFCTFERVLKQVEALVRAGADVQPILSENAYDLDTRFMAAEDLRERLERMTGYAPWHLLTQVEPIGPKKLLDLILVAPCTGNTLAKLGAGIADGPVLLACKSMLRNGRPVLLAVSTNDGLNAAAKNIGLLLARKHIYFVPFGQDDPVGKPTSLVACMEYIPASVEAALEHRQLQPVLVSSGEALMGKKDGD